LHGKSGFEQSGAGEKVIKEVNENLGIVHCLINMLPFSRNDTIEEFSYKTWQEIWR